MNGQYFSSARKAIVVGDGKTGTELSSKIVICAHRKSFQCQTPTSVNGDNTEGLESPNL
jgi:hypothetical protein